MVHHVMGRAFARGVTLVELLVALTVMTVLLTVAIPAFSDMLHNSRLRGAADNLMADLRQAMSESVKRDENLSVTFQPAANGLPWCYGYSIGSACNCQQANACTIDGVERITTGEGHAGVTLTPGLSQNRVSIQPRRGSMTAGNVLFTAEHGKQVKVVINGFGRIRACSPSGSANLPGYPLC